MNLSSWLTTTASETTHNRFLISTHQIDSCKKPLLRFNQADLSKSTEATTCLAGKVEKVDAPKLYTALCLPDDF